MIRNLRITAADGVAAFQMSTIAEGQYDGAQLGQACVGNMMQTPPV